MAGFNPVYLLDGSAIGPLLVASKDDLTVYPCSITFATGDTYLTGGLPVTLPDEFSERKVVDVLLSKAHDGTRRWEWDGSQDTPMILAYDGHATEEGDGTDIAGVVLRAVFLLK